MVLHTQTNKAMHQIMSSRLPSGIHRCRTICMAPESSTRIERHGFLLFVRTKAMYMLARGNTGLQHTHTHVHTGMTSNVITFFGF